MKGITECIKWLLNNPSAKIHDKDGTIVWFDGKSKFEFFHKDEVREFTSFYMLNDGEWLEMKQVYSFDEAYNQCKNIGTRFIQYEYDPNQSTNHEELYQTRKGDMYKSGDGVAIITNGEYSSVRVDGKWYVNQED